MTAPQSTPLPPAGQRGEKESVYIPKQNAFVAAQEPFRVELQAQADFVNTKSIEVDASAAEAKISEELAQAAGNFIGEWSTLTGAVLKGVSVSHNEFYWGAVVDIADITLAEPSVSADWLMISRGYGTAAEYDTGTAAGQIPLNSDLGSSSIVDTGTAAGEVPLNSDLGSSSIVDTGTAPTEIPRNNDLPDEGSEAELTTGTETVTRWWSPRTIARWVVQFFVKSVDTAVDLRALEPLIDGQQISLLGHTNAGIGGGTFYYDAGDTTSVDNNGTVIITPLGARWKRTGVINLSCEGFGALAGGAASTNLTAINNCITAQLELGGGRPTIGSGTFEINDTIIIKRKVVLIGNGDISTVITLANSSNVDMVKSENFDALTMTAKTTTDPLCPFSFGFENIQFDGNKANQTSGGGMSLYGPRLIFDKVMVFEAYGNGMYTEYSPITGSIDPDGQEEGTIGSVITRNCGGIGWLFRGPHNTVIDNLISAFNEDWGFRNESLANVYDGNITQIGHIHTYANGNNTFTNRESYFGSVTAITLLVIDGGYSEIAASDCQIDTVKQIFGGQSNDGLIISGNHNNIGLLNGSMFLGTSGFNVLNITGSNNYVGRARVTGQLNNHKGVVISGSGNTVADFDARECSVGLDVSGGFNTVNGKITTCTDGFNYTTPTGTHPGKNKINLNIFQTSGNYVTGDGPVNILDQFDIVAAGQGDLTTDTALQTPTFPLDITTPQNFTIAHGLVYTPRREQVSLTRLSSSPTDTTIEPLDYRVQGTDATNVIINARMQSPAAAGDLGRIGIKIKI